MPGVNNLSMNGVLNPYDGDDLVKIPVNDAYGRIEYLLRGYPNKLLTEIGWQIKKFIYPDTDPNTQYSYYSFPQDANGDESNQFGFIGNNYETYTYPTKLLLPTLVSAVVPAAGTTIVLTFNKKVSVGAGGNAGWSANFTTQGATTMTYASGSGTVALVYSLNKTVTAGEQGTAAYTQPGNGLEDALGADLATIASKIVTNNSTQ